MSRKDYLETESNPGKGGMAGSFAGSSEGEVAGDPTVFPFETGEAQPIKTKAHTTAKRNCW